MPFRLISRRGHVRTTIGSAIVVAALFAAPAAQAATVYVSPSGSDAGSGTASSPFGTIGKALVGAKGGDNVIVAPGSYPKVTDKYVRSSDVTVRSATATRPSVAGLMLAGAQHLRFVGFKFTAQVMITQHGVLGQGQPSEHVGIAHSEITTQDLRGPVANNQCVVIRSGSKDVAIENNYIHDCGSGILSGSPIDPVSIGLTIRGNEIARFQGDAVKFGRWANVAIEANNIHDIGDPALVTHNDAIQLLGGTSNVRISRNRLHDSRQQLIFVQDMTDQPNTNIQVDNNLLYNSGAIAVQFQGAIGARFINNTQWASALGGVLVRKGSSSNIPQDTVVADNIMSGFNKLDAVGFTYVGNNVTPYASSTVTGQNDHVLAAPGFVNAGAGDYRLAINSPARGLGNSAFATVRDIDGHMRLRGTPGAYAIGDVAVVTGQVVPPAVPVIAAGTTAAALQPIRPPLGAGSNGAPQISAGTTTEFLGTSRNPAAAGPPATGAVAPSNPSPAAGAASRQSLTVAIGRGSARMVLPCPPVSRTRCLARVSGMIEGKKAFRSRCVTITPDQTNRVRVKLTTRASYRIRMHGALVKITVRTVASALPPATATLRLRHGR